MYSIIIDQREPDWIKQLQIPNAQCVVSMLDCGDLWVVAENGDFFIVERKTPQDFVQSLKDDLYDKGHIFNQVTKMREQTKECYVVITGQFIPGPNGKIWINQRETGWTYESVFGAIRTIQKMGCIVSFCKDDSDFAKEIKRLADDRGDVNLGVIKKSTILSPGESMLTAFEGLGYEKVKKLLTEYKNNPAEALCWLTWLDFEISGLGISDGIKNNVRRALGLQPNQKLYIQYEGEEIPF